MPKRPALVLVLDEVGGLPFVEVRIDCWMIALGGGRKDVGMHAFEGGVCFLEGVKAIVAVVFEVAHLGVEMLAGKDVEGVQEVLAHLRLDSEINQDLLVDAG